MHKKNTVNKKLPYLIVCVVQTSRNDGFRIEYATYEEAYRKYLHTVWYYISRKSSINIVCSMFHNNNIVYNYTQKNGTNSLVDCLDGSKTAMNIGEEYLSKLILSAIIEYEAINEGEHNE